MTAIADDRTFEPDDAAAAGDGTPRGTRPTVRTPNRLAVFTLAFGVLLTLFVVRNRTLLSQVVDESGDSAANSILIHQAKHFELLVGAYSRLGFAHPGPAFFYVEALGEWLLHDRLRVVPSAWNGQVLAVLALNAALLAATCAIFAGWVRSWAALALASGTTLGFIALHGHLVTAGWTPYLAFAPFLLLLASGASVAAGRIGDLWAFGLAGGLLVHGHVQFLLFVPAIALVTLAIVVIWHRRGLLRDHRVAWLLLLVVLALFALPLVLNVVLHWPGEFGRYVAYGESEQAGGHPLAAATGYVLRFWPGGPAGPIAASVVIAFVVLLAGRRPAWPGRRFVATGVALAALATVLLAGYAVRGIDDLSQNYVGEFYRAVPLLLCLLIILSVGDLVTGRIIKAFAGVFLALGLAVTVPAPSLVAAREHIDGVPDAVDLMESRAAGRPVVLHLRQQVWPEMAGLVIGARRRGVRLCVSDPSWQFMVTREFVCRRQEREQGLAFLLSPGQAPAGATTVARVGRAVLSTAASPNP